MSLLTLKQTVKRFPTIAVGPFDFEISKPGAWALTGESGVGKSTLLNLIGCLDTPSKGEVFIGGKNVSNLEDKELSSMRLHDIGFVHQFFDLLPDISVVENVLVPLWLADKDNAQEIALKSLERVGMIDSRNQLTRELSGGQKQRVAIARAIALTPQLLLADEPTGSLDRKNSDLVIDLLLEIQEETKNLLIIATHNQRIADILPSRIHIEETKVNVIENQR